MKNKTLLTNILSAKFLVLVMFCVLIPSWIGVSLMNKRDELRKGIAIVEKQLEQKNQEFEDFKKTDQILVNQKLIEELKAIKLTYAEAVTAYEKLIEVKGDKKQFGKIDTYFASILSQLAKENYASASGTLKTLEEEIKKEMEKKAVAAVPVAKSPSGQEIKTNSGDFKVNVISADLKTTKVLVDTASDKDCQDNCPVLPLGTFASRSGAFAAINGPYFCPATYPACANKKNSFDTLMMNKAKTYFNSDNNVYSSVPAAIFSTTSRFVTKSQEWGRDTGIDSVIAGQPLLVFNGQSQFSGDGDPKKSGKGTRAFIGATDSTVYIGLVYNATVAEAATVIAGMGIKNAINLDSGGSTAMWSNGKYIVGPGRDLPFGIVLVRR